VVRIVGIYSMFVDQVGFVLIDYSSELQLCKHHSEHFLHYLKVVQVGSSHIYDFVDHNSGSRYMSMDHGRYCYR